MEATKLRMEGRLKQSERLREASQPMEDFIQRFEAKTGESWDEQEIAVDENATPDEGGEADAKLQTFAAGDAGAEPVSFPDNAPKERKEDPEKVDKRPQYAFPVAPTA
jgi:hypothetical protein